MASLSSQVVPSPQQGHGSKCSSFPLERAHDAPLAEARRFGLVASEAERRCHKVPTGYNKDFTNGIVSTLAECVVIWRMNLTLATAICHCYAARAMASATINESTDMIGGRTTIENRDEATADQVISHQQHNACKQLKKRDG